ncbi:hypothetical protein R5R35_000473 [Gryllus longicercus]|uniref:Poly [ADP-ribose] polymerase n=1 Tax=Gryllus longicercus TaxID=2509291 RepID=A0AAN9VJS0_9ORTH
MDKKTKKNQKKNSCKGSSKSLVNYLQFPKEWHKNFDEKEAFCSKLPPTSEEYLLVYSRITSTLDCNITSIKRIENPFLLGCYLLKKKEYKAKGIKVKEQKVFHCTSESNVSNIVKNNFDWRKTIRGKFGLGVSFSPSARYADRHANSSIGIKRAMIMVKVLTGRVLNANYGFKVPPSGFDTTAGNGNMVYVKYDDYEFYPMFVAYYS